MDTIGSLSVHTRPHEPNLGLGNSLSKSTKRHPINLSPVRLADSSFDPTAHLLVGISEQPTVGMMHDGNLIESPWDEVVEREDLTERIADTASSVSLHEDGVWLGISCPP